MAGGSTTIRTSSGAIRIPWTARLEYVDKEGIARVAKGRTFDVGGQDIDLFPTGVLCGILGRTYRCIYKWEKNFGFPRAMYQVTDDKRYNRWYSRKQLAAIRAIYESMGRLRKENRTKLNQFIAAVRKVFFTIDAPIQERKRDGS